MKWFKKRVTRKIIVWAVLLIIGIPNVVLGEPVTKIVGLLVIFLVIWWDRSASKKNVEKDDK